MMESTAIIFLVELPQRSISRRIATEKYGLVGIGYDRQQCTQTLEYRL